MPLFTSTFHCGGVFPRWRPHSTLFHPADAFQKWRSTPSTWEKHTHFFLDVSLVEWPMGPPFTHTSVFCGQWDHFPQFLQLVANGTTLGFRRPMGPLPVYSTSRRWLHHTRVTSRCSGPRETPSGNDVFRICSVFFLLPEHCTPESLATYQLPAIYPGRMDQMLGPNSQLCFCGWTV